MWNGQHPYKRLHWKVTNSIHSRWWKSSKTSFYKLKAFHKIFAVFMINVTEHHVTMPRARNQEVLQKCSCAQATIEWTWSNGNPYCCLSVALVDSAFFLLRVRSSHKKPQLNSWHSEMRVYRAFALSPGITITSSFWANSMNLYGPCVLLERLDMAEDVIWRRHWLLPQWRSPSNNPHRNVSKEVNWNYFTLLFNKYQKMLKLQQAWLRYQAWRNISPWSHNAALPCANQSESQTDYPRYNSKRDPLSTSVAVDCIALNYWGKVKRNMAIRALTNRKATSSLYYY